LTPEWILTTNAAHASSLAQLPVNNKMNLMHAIKLTQAAVVQPMFPHQLGSTQALPLISGLSWSHGSVVDALDGEIQAVGETTDGRAEEAQDVQVAVTLTEVAVIVVNLDEDSQEEVLLVQAEVLREAQREVPREVPSHAVVLNQSTDRNQFTDQSHLAK